MLKNRLSTKEEETRAGEALRGLLKKIPILQVEGFDVEAMSDDWEPDLIARLLVGGHPHLLICEYKSNGQPRYARSALLELRNYIVHRAPQATPVFIAPYISPAVRRLCEDMDVGYLDLEGNARIAFGGVFIERVVADRPAAEQRELKSLFRPKSAQVLRATLAARALIKMGLVVWRGQEPGSEYQRQRALWMALSQAGAPPAAPLPQSTSR